MYKLVVFSALLAVAAAAPGLIASPYAGLSPYGGIAAPLAAPLASPWGHGLIAPSLVSPVRAALPVATSYANSVRIASPVLAASAPVVSHGGLIASPLAHAW